MLQCKTCREVFERPRLVLTGREEVLECPRCQATEFRVLNEESGYSA